MKKSISATLLTIFFLTSCAAQTKINVSKNLDQQAPPDEIAAIQLLESLLKEADPKIVNKNWQGMKESFPKGCEKSLDRYDLADSKVKCNTLGFNESRWSAAGC